MNDQTIKDIVSMDHKARQEFFRQILWQIPDAEIEEMFDVVCKAYQPHQKVENWMEKRLKGDLSLTPLEVAGEYRHFKRIDSRMMPYLIRVAQRIKHRIRMRIKRSESCI